MEEDESSELTETSDSEDDLEETPAFIRQDHSENDTDIKGKVSRLDALLAEHKRESEKQNRLRALRDQLLTEIASSSEERIKSEEHQDLSSEHANNLEKLKVKSIQLRTVHPGLAVLNADKFGCLFSDEVDPQNYFVNTDSRIDKVWLDFMHGDSSESRDGISNMLMFPSIFITKIATSPNFNGVMQWLLDLLSVHSSSTKASRIEETMLIILSHLQHQRTGVLWKPSALGMLRLLVNLGASPQYLTEFQTAFTPDDIRKHLDKVKDKRTKQTPNGKVNSERFRAVLTVLAHSLKGRSVVPKEDLTLMFYMLANVSLDTSLDRYLDQNFHQCFAAIIEHYSECDWPDVVPDLCLQLSQITDHHHNQVHLIRLMPAGSRGSYLQLRVSYTFLYNQLLPGGNKLEPSKLKDIQLVDVLELGVPAVEGQPSSLAVGLHNLVQTNCYMAFSILELLNIFVGDVSCRAAVQKKQLEYLVSQVTLVRKTIRDRLSDLDLLKVKDVMNDMTVKWSLGLQDQRMKEGSIFPWATATTHQLVKPEILFDRKEQNVIDKGEDNLLSSVDRQSEAP